MAKILALLASLLLYSSFFPLGSGAPTTTAVKYPDVIPGPGMPSLESLGLTSKMLYEMGIPDHVNATRGLMRRSSYCLEGPPEIYTSDGGACYNYLNMLGSTQCGLFGQGNNIQFVYAGSAQVLGVDVGPNVYVGSDCSDVAIGVYYSLQDCQDIVVVNKNFGGLDVANGNGDLRVVLTHS